jgi:hypothetical protein
MASNFVFVSPGLKFKERDLSFVSKNVGLTTLGLVGETPKGPAFQPIAVTDKGNLSARFGTQSIEKYPNGDLKYQLPYVANAYMDESDQLVITRVLGLSGYEAGHAWGLKVSAGVDLNTTSVTSTGTSSASFTGGVYLGTTITNIGQTGTIFTGYTKTSPTQFTTIIRDFTVATLVNGAGTVNLVVSTVTGSSLSKYEGMVVAIVRSRASVEDVVDGVPITTFEATQLQMIANSTTIGSGDFFAKFTLRAGTGLTNTEDYIVSLNPDSREFITNVLGDKPKGKNTKIYVEAVYPDLIKKLDADGVAYGVSSSIIDANTPVFNNYKDTFKTPETPWVVSELRGNKIDRLFKFVSISDGNSANQEIKISIQNIDPITKEFDVIVRDFYDTDNNVSVLESYSRCTMQKGLNNYIGNRIGTIDGEFSIQGNYIMVDIDQNAPEDSFPAGFEGYVIFDWATGSTGSIVSGQSPEILYKANYLQSDKLNRTYLGISERAFDGNNLQGSGIDQNFYNYNGLDISSINGNAPLGYVKTKGYHMDSTATATTYYDGSTLIGSFVTGAATFQTASDVTNQNNIYSNKSARKFTFVPYGGFDGWNEHRVRRSNTDLFRKGGIFDGVPNGATPNNDFQAWETAINTFANGEEVTINLFATPGINFSDNLVIVNDTIDMIEQRRADSLYIVDAPDLPDTPSLASDIVDLLDTANLDSNYTSTFYPWIQIRDQINNQNVYIPPTAEVVKAIAFTDNVKFPWFAPAGLQRGVTDAIRTRRKLSLEERDILYAGRINPMATFPDVGVAIFGQKTLQKKESALDRINVRRLLLQLKVLISNVATRLLFEQNDQATIDEFLAKTNPILETVKRERGVEDFKIVMDGSNNTPESKDRNELYGEIFIKPTRAVEFIGLTFTITPSGANFANI